MKCQQIGIVSFCALGVGPGHIQQYLGVKGTFQADGYIAGYLALQHKNIDQGVLEAVGPDDRVVRYPHQVHVYADPFPGPAHGASYQVRDSQGLANLAVTHFLFQ